MKKKEIEDDDGPLIAEPANPGERRTLADKRQSLVDPNYTGEDYCIDAEIEKGPLANRRCTDILCCLVFLVCLGISGYISIYIVEHGDPALVIAPYDALGNFCGRDPGFEEYPYLWY